MPRLIAAFTHHHDSEKLSWKEFVHDEADALRQAIVHLGVDEDSFDVGETHELLALAKKAGSEGVNFQIDVDGEPDDFVVWCFAEGPGLNFGVGRGATIAKTDKRDNCWIAVCEWVPDLTRKA